MDDEGTMRVLEDGSFERYIKASGAKCPFCGSIEIHSGAIEVMPGEILYNMECLLCEGDWQDIYKLVGIKALGEGLERVFPDSG